MTHTPKLNGPTSLIFLGLYLFLSFQNVESGIENAKCPLLLQKITEGRCAKVNCEHHISKDRCPSKTIYVGNFALCGCCPSCVRYLRPDDEDELCVQPNSPGVVWHPDPNCDDEEGFCPVRVNTCLEGLVCNAEGRCELPDPTKVHNPETEECNYRKSLRQLGLVHWDPDCEADGSFAPKQCKGTQYDGECFCVDRGGNRIFGRQWRLIADNQTCACSRRAHYLRAQGLTATFHCTPDGNYEPLQCDTDSGVCYCVDPITGELDGAVLPEPQWKSLPCFSLNVTNNHTDGKYLRQCESEFAGLWQLVLTGREHGLEYQTKILRCDFDGSYAPEQIVHTSSECVFKNGTKIRAYSLPRGEDGAVTCNCARDKDEYLPSQERAFTFDCEQRTGNYEPVYDFGSYVSCVDKDGFLYGDIAPSRFHCCLMDDGCSPELSKDCYKPESDKGFKPCAYWRYRY